MSLAAEGLLIAQITGYLLFLPVLWWLGNAFCRGVLAMAGAEAAASGMNHGVGSAARQIFAAGRTIGILERSLILLGIVTGRWEVMAAVVALKTVARYRELDKQLNAEYFLVGSLASILWAVLVAGALLLFDSRLGLSLLPPSP